MNLKMMDSSFRIVSPRLRLFRHRLASFNAENNIRSRATTTSSNINSFLRTPAHHQSRRQPSKKQPNCLHTEKPSPSSNAKNQPTLGRTTNTTNRDKMTPFAAHIILPTTTTTLSTETTRALLFDQIARISDTMIGDSIRSEQIRTRTSIMRTVTGVIKGLRAVMRQKERNPISIHIGTNLTIIIINSRSNSNSHISKRIATSRMEIILIGTVFILCSSWIGHNGTGTTA